MADTAKLGVLPALLRRPEQVADALRKHLLSGQLKPGGQLPSEQAMAEQFAVSRTVVREAIVSLKSEGLIETRQGAGAFVCDRSRRVQTLRLHPVTAKSIASVLHIVELRKGIETEAAALAAGRRTARDLRAIKSALAAIAADVQRGGDGIDADVTFHQAIASASHNPYLIATLEYLQHFLHGAVRVARTHEARRSDFMQEVEAEHAAIVGAIERGDAAAARRCASAHMDGAQRRFREADVRLLAEEGSRFARELSKKRGVEKKR